MSLKVNLMIRHSELVCKYRVLISIIAAYELRERLGIDDTISVLQQNRLRWYGHVLRKEDNDWVKKWVLDQEVNQRGLK